MWILVKLLKMFQTIIKKTDVIVYSIFWFWVFLLIFFIQPWNIEWLYNKFSLEYKKTKIYEKTTREQFKKEVFWQDITLIDWIKKHIFPQKFDDYKVENLETFKIWETKKIKTKDWIIKNYYWETLKEWEEIVMENIQVWNLFELNDFVEFLKSIWFKWNQFHSIFDDTVFKDWELIKLYEEIIKDINDMYKWYIVSNKKDKTYYIFLMMKTQWELIDNWINNEKLYTKIKELNQSFYSKIWTLISEKYREISSLAPHDKWMLQLVKYQDNFSKLIEKRKTKYKFWKHDLLIFNFFWNYSNFNEYAKEFIWSEEFINKLLFKKLLNLE